MMFNFRLGEVCAQSRDGGGFELVTKQPDQLELPGSVFVRIRE